ncbi:phytanoyl-CoA dioxygenase family protein [Leptospira meyeri]|uniref:phytanoyl-CoA dioxygenase family protein n=1 Tax=Leptospira meyeri TaxID=29508 RepID=UPI00223CE0CD|nr:phytanoyl-CoA dioxygenase family protein [Leptospira meyeri]MCW7490398.1 phytanoyl-CoA dioxygenase family protein [Leptospira meyeri]
MFKWFKKILNLLRGIVEVRRGFVEFAKTGNTPPEAYIQMINLFCATGGLSNDLIHQMIKSPKRKFPVTSGILGNFTESELSKVTMTIKEKGYFVFENVLSDEIGNYLYELGCNTELYQRPLDSESYKNKPIYSKFNPSLAPASIRYDFDEGMLINDPIIQSIMTDFSVLSIAQSYLGCLPKADVTGMWWHTDFSKEPNAEAATMWHFDMDRVKWLKIFFYLTDVTPETGPHCFIEGSHRTRGIPKHFLKYGYSRLSDRDVEDYYPKEKYIEYNAKKFTVIVEDTRGLHKGRAVTNGSRLIFQTQFSDHLFGGTYSSKKINRFANAKTEEFIKLNKDIYERFL